MQIFGGEPHKKNCCRKGYVLLVTLVWIIRDGSLNQGKLCLPTIGWRIKSSDCSYPWSGTGWFGDQIPHCRWGRCTGSFRRSSHTGPPHTVPSSSHTRLGLKTAVQQSQTCSKNDWHTVSKNNSGCMPTKNGQLSNKFGIE